MVEEKDSLSKFYTIAVALFLTVPAINMIGVAVFPALSGALMTVLYAVFGACIIAVAGVAFGNSKRMYIVYAVALLTIISYYIATMIIAPYSDLSAAKFLSMTVAAFVCFSVRKVDPRLLIKALILISCPALFWFNKVFIVTSGLAEVILMGIGYAFVPSIVSSFVYLFWYIRDERKDKLKWLYIVGCFINLVFAFRIIEYGSRGPVLCMIVCLVVCICFDNDKEKGIRLRSWKVVLVGIAVALIAMNFWVVLGTVSSLLKSFGISVNTIDKFYRLNEQSKDALNGRSDIWAAVASEMLRSPLWGHGMSTTLHNLKYPYPHNFLLQFLYDGGLLLTLPVLGPFLAGLVKFIARCRSKDLFCMGTVMFCMSVPCAFLSTDLWENGQLWVTFSFFVLWSIDDYAIKYTRLVNRPAKIKEED